MVTHWHFRGVVMVTLAVVAVTALADCSRRSNERVSQGGRHQWTVPGILRIAAAADPPGLNPIVTADSQVFDLSMFVYSWAVRYDSKAQPVPDALFELPTIANGDVSKDGLTLKYRLRHNITWQDGAPLTCSDLAFTWRVVMNPHNDVVITDGYRDIRTIDCSDPYVAVVHMKRVYAPYLQQLWGVNGNAPILPVHLLAKYNDDKGSFNRAPYNALPIGSGPFRVVEWKRGEEVRLAANPRFYLGKPKLNEVVFKIIPDRDTAVQQLRTHAIDLLAPGYGSVVASAAGGPRNGLAMEVSDSFIFSRLDFNLKRPILDDRNVRIALAYGFDRAGMVRKLSQGFAIPADTDQHPRLSWAYTNDVMHYPYDPQKARATLEADGWRVGDDGVRIKNGQRLEFSISAGGNSPHPMPFEILLQREWHDIGVELNVKNHSVGAFVANTSYGILEGGHYDVAAIEFDTGADPDDSAFYSADNLAPRGQNTTQWNNARATAAINDALRTVDRARRRRDYVVVQQQLAHDVPSIILAFGRVPYAYNSDLKGFDPSPVISPFWNPWSYSI